MKIIKVTGSAGNRPAPIMEEEKEEGKTKGKTASLLKEEEEGKMKGKTPSLLEEEKEDGKTKGKTASLLEEEPSDSHQRRLQEEAGEFEWAWKRESVQGHGNKLKMSLTYKKTVFKDISSVLFKVGKEELEQQFVDGCFGHLMNFIGGTNCIRAMYELIAREINAPKAEDGLWFRIGGTNIRFSPKEFALVTGLNFGSSTFDPLGSHEIPKEGVCKRCFRGRSINVDELWEKYNSQSVRDGSPQDYLKVANVLALYLMVLGYDQHKAVEKWVWVLVEDLDSWNRFPWGAYSYQALMYYIGSIPKTRDDFVIMRSFHGPMWALQIWAYEAIPELGKTCAEVAPRATMIPRCLKWSFLSKKIKLTHFFKEELQCFANLDPTDEEKLQKYWASVQTRKPLGVRYARPQRRRIRAAGRKGDDSVSWQEQHSSDSDGSARSPSPRRKRTCVPQGFDEAIFLDRVSDRVVERLSQWLIPQMKQLMESRQLPSQPQPSREVHDKRLKGELKRKAHMSPCEGGEAKLAKKENDKKKKRSSKSKQMRRSSSSSEDEVSESSSGNERRRKLKKSSKKKKKRKHSESSSSEGSSDRDRHRRKRNRHKRRHSSSSEASDSVSQ